MTNARESLGRLLHTLQDFYSHSNWIEMGNTNINNLIGVKENIGSVADRNQATCTKNGCTKIEKKCVSNINTISFILFLELFRFFKDSSATSYI